ncbi:toxin-antitoxin system YwqK family antitoxin [Algoriphagus sp.]|uniref:toxin-antitoxin system YwqK family antitoxin n=1 Tax=Algoriphagus sp. TaxID=1872435 RepID=UPI003524D306
MRFEDFYINKKLKEEGNLIDGLKDGIWKEYYPSGKIKVLKNYCQGEKHGIFEFYKETGELDFKVHYHFGRVKISNLKIRRLDFLG